MEDLLKRNKYVDQLTLESDIIILNKKLNTTFAEETHIEKVYVEVPTKVVERVEVASVAQPEPQPTSPEVTAGQVISPSPEPIVIAEEPENLDETNAILKRYPTYSPKLAMMMAKSKKNNSSVTDTATVELKKRAKDLKKPLPRSEIRDFIDNRTKRM